MATPPNQVQSQSFDQFPDERRQDVEGLIWIGYLEDGFEFCGHRFHIRTLRGSEELNAALVSKEYAESLGQAKAWAWAVVGLALLSVDGDEAFCPPAGPNSVAYARARFQYVTSNWYWPTAEYIYSRYADLIERQVGATKALQDLSTRSLPIFSPSAGSSTDPGISESTPDET